MLTQATAADLTALRSHVRRSQHVRSVPLLVLGSLLVNYGVVNFSAAPVAWRYGAPLAFVLVWALGKANEMQRGVGPSRADYLVAAGFVFTASNVVLLHLFAEHLQPDQVEGIWVLIVGVALAGLAVGDWDVLLGLSGLVMAATGVVGFFIGGDVNDGLPFNVAGQPSLQSWPNVAIAAVGAFFALTGLLLYRTERAAR